MCVSIYICKDWEMYSYIVVDVHNNNKKKGGSPRTPGQHLKHTGMRNESSHMKEMS